jgi:hypothetical protein
VVFLTYHQILNVSDDFSCSSKEGVLSIFIALKNSSSLAGFELANLESDSRPPRAIYTSLKLEFIRMIKSRIMKLARHVLCMKKTRNSAYTILVGRYE